MPLKAKAKAHSNIALVKYWGKRDSALKLPNNGSISLTLDKLYTETEISFSDDFDTDQLWLNGQKTSGKALTRVSGYLDLFRQVHDCQLKAQVKTQNSFPTAAGLASSASGFAALAHAAQLALGLNLSLQELSILARKGSGSASRSVFGGFVEWHKGTLVDGSDSFASPIIESPNWNLSMVVLVLESKEKSISSSVGMQRTVDTSPLYSGWLESIEADLTHMRQFILDQDFEGVGKLMEHNALKMHATAMASQPSVFYWSPTSLKTIEWIQSLRNKGLPCYMTMDAGPNVKVLVESHHLPQFLSALKSQSQVESHFVCESGPGIQGQVL